MNKEELKIPIEIYKDIESYAEETCDFIEEWEGKEMTLYAILQLRGYDLCQKHSTTQAVEFAKWKDDNCVRAEYSVKWRCLLGANMTMYDYDELYNRYEIYLKEQGA